MSVSYRIKISQLLMVVNKWASSLNQPWKNTAENMLVIFNYSLLIEGDGFFVLCTLYKSQTQTLNFSLCCTLIPPHHRPKSPH